jgi:hypothetical protein
MRRTALAEVAPSEPAEGGGKKKKSGRWWKIKEKGRKNIKEKGTCAAQTRERWGWGEAGEHKAGQRNREKAAGE